MLLPIIGLSLAYRDIEKGNVAVIVKIPEVGNLFTMTEVLLFGQGQQTQSQGMDEDRGGNHEESASARKRI